MKTEKRVALITGGTGGIGRALAERLARDGYQIVIVGRNTERGQLAVQQIQQHTADVQFIQADLSLMHEVKRLADTFRQHYSRLDMLVHSAGVIYTRRELTSEGLEISFATDYLSRFYLTELLMDCLKDGSPARILNIAAAGSGMGKLHFDDLLGERRIGGMRGLGQAQFANDVHTIELARRLEGSRVRVYAIHPGMVNTGIRRELPEWLNGIMNVLFSWITMSPEQGAEAPYYLLTSPEVDSLNGGLFQRKKQVGPAKDAADPATGQRLWQVSEQLVQEAMG